MTAQHKKGSEEFFYRDADGKKQDAELHNAILDEGDHDAAKAVSDKIRARILGKHEQQKQWAAAKARALELLKDYDESKHPRDDKGRWTEGGGSDGDGSSKIGGGSHVVAFHGTIESVVASIRKEGLRVTAERHHFEGDVYAGDRGESVFVTTEQTVAIEYASTYAQSKSWKEYKAVAPVLFRLEIPQDEWVKFKEDKLRPETGSHYTKAIPPEWIAGVFNIKGDNSLEPLNKAASDKVTAYMVIFVGEPKDK